MARTKRLNTASLRDFLAVVDSGSFSEAAERMGISQPAVSLSIKHIEDECGIRLFDRSHGKCRLTEEGSLLVEYARRVVDAEDKFYAAVDEVRGEVVGRFEVISSSIPGEYALPTIIGEFNRKFPKVELMLDISDSYKVIERIKSGEKEIGFTGVEPHDEELIGEPFCPDTLILIAAADDPLAGKEIGEKDLRGARYVLREDESGQRRIMLDALESIGIEVEEIDVAMELSSTSGVISAVEGGAGISMTSCLAAGPRIAEGSVVPLQYNDLVVRRQLYMVRRKEGDLSRAAMTFLEFVEEKKPYLLRHAERVLARCGE